MLAHDDAVRPLGGGRSGKHLALCGGAAADLRGAHKGTHEPMVHVDGHAALLLRRVTRVRRDDTATV